MMKEQKPTLTDTKGMGGIHAQAGFEYQVWDALARLPAWLRDPSFEGLANEALEDIEARFFAPHSPTSHVLERFQAKSGQLTKSEIRRVFEDFQRFETSYPAKARVQTLVTSSLPNNLIWLARDTERVRRARSFYDPFVDIKTANDEKLRQDLIQEFGLELGSFVSEFVNVFVRVFPDQFSARIAFATAFEVAFPNLNLSQRTLQDAHSALYDLCTSNRGCLISRSQLLALLCKQIDKDLVLDTILPLNIVSDCTASRDDVIEIDARPFAGGNLGIPSSEEWQNRLLPPLISTRNWARKRDIKRIGLSGSFRLSTAFTIGWAFRSALGFDIDIPTRMGNWPTDVHPPATQTAPSWEVSRPKQLLGERLMISIGIMREPSHGILNTFVGMDEEHMLKAHLPAPISNPTDVQLSVRIIKRVIDETCSTLRPASIDLFYTGPTAFAVALGHRWNSLPDTQFYEYSVAQQIYRPTVYLS